MPKRSTQKTTTVLRPLTTDDRRLLHIERVERRLEKIRHALVIIEHASKSYDLDQDAGAAIGAIAESARNELHWITALPARVLNLPAPTDDDVALWSGSVDNDLTSEQANSERERIIIEAMQKQGGR